MTTIAVSRSAIACDLQYSYGGNMKFKGNSKIFKMDHPACKELFGAPYAYIGFAGQVNYWGQIIQWLSDPTGDIPKTKNVEFLLLNSKGQIYHGDNLSNWMRLEDKHFSIGSGMQFAMAAMEAGKPPLEAVKIASKYDPHTGLGFKEYKIK